MLIIVVHYDSIFVVAPAALEDVPLTWYTDVCILNGTNTMTKPSIPDPLTPTWFCLTISKYNP